MEAGRVERLTPRQARPSAVTAVDGYVAVAEPWGQQALPRLRLFAKQCGVVVATGRCLRASLILGIVAFLSASCELVEGLDEEVVGSL